MYFQSEVYYFQYVIDTNTDEVEIQPETLWKLAWLLLMELSMPLLLLAV